MSVQIKGYCYNTTGQLCVAITHMYGVANAAAVAAAAKHTIVVNVGGRDHTFEVDGSSEFTFCQDSTTGPITVSDDDGGSDSVAVDPPDESNKCGAGDQR